MICPNINSPEWQKLTSQVNTHTAYDLWDKYNGNVPQSAIDEVLGKIPTTLIITPAATPIKPGVEELFDSNPELANQVYEALGFKQTVIQDDKSYYRGQIEEPTVDKNGNLVLYAREDELYKRAGLKSKGISMTDDLQSAIEYGNGQLQVAQNLASESYDANQELERLSENGYYLIQIPKNVSNEIVKEAGEVKVIGDKIIIPKGQYKIEQVVDGVEQITPQQKQQALQLYSQYLDTIFPDSKVKDIVYHGTDRTFEQFSKDAEKATISDQGMFFAPTWNQARNSGKNIIKALINSNPLISDNRIERISEKKKQELLSQGYTGYVYSYNKTISSADDIVVFEPEQIHILGNKQDIEGFKAFAQTRPATAPKQVSLEEANASLESKLRNILSQLGIKYEAVQEITGVPGQKLGPVAQADLLNKVIQVVEGRADKTTLTEEVVHFLVAMLDTNSHVYQSMFEAITKYPVFQEVVKEYGSLPGYTEEKLRREAMAKLITKEVINLDEQSRLTPQQQKVASNWWNMLLSKIKQMFNSFDKAKFENAMQEYSPFRDLAYKIAQQDLSLFNQEITDTHTYYQLSNAPNEKQKAVLEKIQAISQGISREGTDETRGYYKGGKKLGKSVTTRRDEKFDVKFKNAKRTPEAEAQMKESGRIGSLVHDDMDNISKRVLSRDGSIAKVIKTNPTIYAKLENFAKGLMKVHGEDAVYLSEQIVYDPSTDTPGTVDLIVIDKDGKVHIYDWKTMMLNKREREEFGEPSYYKTVKYEYQLNSYKDIIEKGGVKDFGKRRYIPIENVFRKDKATGAVKFVDININIPGSRIGEKPYLNPVPVSNEKTGDETIDKLISQLLALQKEARAKTAAGPVEQAKKTQKIISLNKAIRDLQLNKNLGLFAETAAVQFKSIEARLADTKTPLSEAELVNMQEELEVYTDLGRKFAPLYEAGKIPDKHIKQFDEISGKASRLAVKINNELATYFKNAANKAGLSDEALQLYKEKGAKPIGLVGKFSRALSRIDHPIFRTFWNLVNKAKTDAKRDSDILQNQIEEKLNALKEWGRSQGLKGTDIFNLMLDKKTGRLISKFSAEFYKTRKQKIADGDWRWMKENTVLDEAGLKKFIKDQEAYIKGTTFSSNVDFNKKIQETKIKELHDNYDVFNNPKAYASQMDFMKKFLKPSEKWFSEGYKTLRNTKPAFDFYTLFTSKMREFNEFMPFTKDDKWTDTDRFIPNLRADLIEKVSTLGGSAAISGLGEDFSDMFDLRYDEEMRLGQINEFTGEYERQVPVYYTKEIDPKEKSYDLGRVLMLFGNKAYNYKYMSQIEGSARNLRNALADSSEALVDGNGKVIKNLLGSNKIVSATTLDTFDSFVNYYVYGVKESEDYGYFTKQKKVINPKTGEEEIVDVNYSKNKIGKAVLRGFATKALGLNLISGGAQIFGNNVNGLVLAVGGQHFKVKDWVKAKALVTSGNFNPEVYQFLQVLDIRGDNEIFKRADKLSVNDTMRQANLEKAFFLYEYADEALFKTLAVSMIQSHGIDANGKIKLLSKLPEGTKSIYEQLTIDKDGKSNLTTLISEEEYRKFRNKVQALGEKITGMSSRDNMSGWRLTMAGQALMQFRGWIPRTLEARFGGAKFDAELDAVEKGRFVSLWNQIANKRMIPLIGEMLKGAVTGQFGVNTDNIVDTLYNQFMEENPHLSREEVTREMFYDMHVANVRAGLMEISLYIGMMILTAGLKEGWDDDDEDKRFKSETLRTLNRFSDEIGFYLNPNSFQAITRGAVPAVGLFTDMGRFFGDLFGETKGRVFNDEVEVHNSKPLWAFMRGFVPGGTTLWNWFGDKSKMKEKED